jgi:hypothetical protein
LVAYKRIMRESLKRKLIGAYIAGTLAVSATAGIVTYRVLSQDFKTDERYVSSDDRKFKLAPWVRYVGGGFAGLFTAAVLLDTFARSGGGRVRQGDDPEYWTRGIGER